MHWREEHRRNPRVISPLYCSQQRKTRGFRGCQERSVFGNRWLSKIGTPEKFCSGDFFFHFLWYFVSVNFLVSVIQKWSSELANVAQKWANTCRKGHNPGRSSREFGSVGENIYRRTGITHSNAYCVCACVCLKYAFSLSLSHCVSLQIKPMLMM